MHPELTLTLARELSEHAARAQRSGFRRPHRPVLLAAPVAALALPAGGQAATVELAINGTSDYDNDEGEPK
jgi:hypothetical protein